MVRNLGGQVYISNSGGVDSTVLSDLVHRIYPDVPDVYCDTGLEYPELREFILSKPNIVALKPELNFVETIKKYGYPMISKEISDAVSLAKRGFPYGIAKMQGLNTNGTPNNFRKGNTKYAYLIDADFFIGDECCSTMKKKPAKKYEKESKRHPYIGTMTEESSMRRTSWLRTGCNAFNSTRPVSTPLAFWTKSDILKYLCKYDIPYAPIYGDIVQLNGKYTTTGCKRTGCVFCGYGCHLEKQPNKFQTLAKTHPQLYDYCMRGGKYEEGKWIPDKGLGMAKVLDFINVKWWNDGDEAKRDEYRNEYKRKEEEEYGIS